jgi:hypothetical protein
MSPINGVSNNYNNLQPIQSNTDLNQTVRRSNNERPTSITLPINTAEQNWAADVYRQVEKILNKGERTDQGTVKLTDAQKDKILSLVTNGASDPIPNSPTLPAAVFGDVKIESTADGGAKLTVTNSKDNSQTAIELDKNGKVSGSYKLDSNGINLEIAAREAEIKARIQRGQVSVEATHNTQNGTSTSNITLDQRNKDGNGSTTSIGSNERGEVTTNFQHNTPTSKTTVSSAGSDVNTNLEVDLGQFTVQASGNINLSNAQGNANITVNGEIAKDVAAKLEVTANGDGTVSGKVTVDANLAKILKLGVGTKLDVKGTIDTLGNATLSLDFKANLARGLNLPENSVFDISGNASIDNTGRFDYKGRVDIGIRF